ncbi:FkbM family methyltransferase [Streptomyces sp. SAJ15]|uniref:FkbM family methyltransferase n=1 Tax=Streptomyces sp. SAJ15 TaxID=2011095 RepID=UPI00118729A3|nr:FkbM family methyltransferase [Streptomyces sp. SAJ15]TVL88751.1 FkbM family methyltransferase [Streptomyces sp. SAJ15]
MSFSLLELADGFRAYAHSGMEARFIYQEIFEDHSYVLPELPEAPLIVDVGANIGLFCIYVKRAYPEARVIAFEPAPESLRALRLNLELHQIDDVTVHPLCLGSERNDAARFAYYPRLPGNSTLRPDDQVPFKARLSEILGKTLAASLFTPRELNVRVERLSDILADSRLAGADIDLIKVDVEGAELDVLHGIDDHDWPRIGNLVVEVGDTDGRLHAVETLLRDRGFTVSSAPTSFMETRLPFYYVTARRG